ncbi:MAG: FtsQ-type POTRA domain-containing protein [Defluviitaleaceae bacterium]|nr:FtsQ-type POTRA domain-containing protein [Defluviitaleaceae bacterium]
MERKVKKRLSFRFIATVAVLILAALGVLLSPLFRVDQIYIEGNQIVTGLEITRNIHTELSVGTNIFAFNASRVAGWIEAMPYVQTASVERQFPRRVVIGVVERQPAVNVRLIVGGYVLVDPTGMVLETVSLPKPELPKVVGMTVESFMAGRYLEAESLAEMLHLTSIFAIYDFVPNLMEFQDPREIIIHKDNFEIEFGGLYQAERKTRYIIGILESTPVDRGFLNISNPSHPRLHFTQR